jgi:exodeoxyribonuclease VII large subunit
VLARLHRAEDDVVHLRERVAALSPAATLARGYAVVQDRQGAVVRSPGDVGPGDRLRIRVHGGELAAVTLSGKEAVSGEDG